jgi:predicted Zn-dependent peptidase
MVAFQKEQLPKNFPKDEPIIKEKEVTTTTQISSFRICFCLQNIINKERDAYVLNMLSAYLSGGKSSVLYKKLVDQEKST